MNLQCIPSKAPLKVLLVQPLLLSGQLLAVKILSGVIFGKDQRIHLIMLVYYNEISSGENLKTQLENCSFHCTSVIELISDLTW